MAFHSKNQKLIQFRVSQELYEDFYRKFPGRGERSDLLRKFMVVAIELADKKDCFMEEIIRELEERHEERHKWRT